MMSKVRGFDGSKGEYTIPNLLNLDSPLVCKLFTTRTHKFEL